VPGRNDGRNMSATIPYERELFRGGPPFWLQKWLHLITPGDPKIARRAIVVVLVGWLPLLLLAVVQGLAWHGGTEGSFLLDFAVHARSGGGATVYHCGGVLHPSTGGYCTPLSGSRTGWLDQTAPALTML